MVELTSTLGKLAQKKVLLQGKFQPFEVARLREMVETMQGQLADELNEHVHIVLTANETPSGTLTKKVASLNKKGATIQILDVAKFTELTAPSSDELTTLFRLGPKGATLLLQLLGSANFFAQLNSNSTYSVVSWNRITLTDCNLNGLHLSEFDFSGLAFERCSFVGASLDNTIFSTALDCDFSKATGENVQFGKIDRSKFVQATLPKAKFVSHLAGSDFTEAVLKEAYFSESFWASRVLPQPSPVGPIFRGANLRGAQFDDIFLDAPVFEEADLTGAFFTNARMLRTIFRAAVLKRVVMVAARANDSDFAHADLTEANLAECHLSGAGFDQTNLAGCNMRGVRGGDFSKAKHLDQAGTSIGSMGAALAELDILAAQAKEMKIRFFVEQFGRQYEVEVTAYGNKTSGSMAYLSLLDLYDFINPEPLVGVQMSVRMIQAGMLFGNHRLLFETVRSDKKQAPKSGKELNELLLRALSEAFAQPIPNKEELTALGKKHREEQARLKEQAAAEKAEAAQATEKKIVETIGAVTDMATFMRALHLRVDKSKIDNATKMLKASKFQLYSDVMDTVVTGVVKSQSDAELVYACSLSSAGNYACCTQNLNICGGLKGSLCKHLLVLIIGLAQAQKLDLGKMDNWLATAHGEKPALNKKQLGDVFLKYKGVEAGDIDWRPTETIPEDYYAF